MVEKEWLSSSKAGRMMGVTAEKMRQHANDGSIPCRVYPSGHRRFSKEVLKKILDGKKAGNPTTLG